MHQLIKSKRWLFDQRNGRKNARKSYLWWGCQNNPKKRYQLGVENVSLKELFYSVIFYFVLFYELPCVPISYGPELVIPIATYFQVCISGGHEMKLIISWEKESAHWKKKNNRIRYNWKLMFRDILENSRSANEHFCRNQPLLLKWKKW